MTLSLHIVLEKPPVGVDFGLQKGSGSQYQTIQTQRSTGADMYFELEVEVKGDRKIDPNPRFAGPFAQGKEPDKFFYIDVGALAGQVGGWSRRIKIPFRGITWDLLDQATTRSKRALKTSIPGTAKDGGPNCATVKPFKGWDI
jgi:hypothetical protein